MSVASRRITNVFLLAGGVALLSLAVVTGLKEWKLVSAGARAEGRIGAVQPPYYNLIFSESGRNYAVARTAPLWGTALHKGDSVSVLYDKEKPSESARVYNPQEIWFIPGLSAFAAFLMLYNLFGRLRERRDARYTLAESDVTSFEPLAIMRWALLFLAVSVIGFNSTRPPPRLEQDVTEQENENPTQDAAGIPFLTAANFKQVMADARIPVLAIAWSDTCRDCVVYDQEFPRIIGAWRGRLNVYKLTDAAVARQLGVTAYPSVLILYRGGVLSKNDNGFFKPITLPDGMLWKAVDEAALWNFIGQAELRARSMPK